MVFFFPSMIYFFQSNIIHDDDDDNDDHFQQMFFTDGKVLQMIENVRFRLFIQVEAFDEQL